MVQENNSSQSDTELRVERGVQVAPPQKDSSTLGILGLCFFWFPIVGLVLGIISLATRERKKVFGIMAIVLSLLGPVLFVSLGVFSALILPRSATVRAQAEQASCRSNMRSLATAEAMFYGMNDEYGTIDELSSSGIMDNARSLTCPTSDEGYVCDASSSTYTIRCSDNSHGSVVDGHCSWTAE